MRRPVCHPRSARRRHVLALLCCAAVLGAAPTVFGQEKILQLFRRDEKTIKVRDPASLPKVPVPDVAPPPTVTEPPRDASARYLGLDDAIRIALANADVIRVLAGVTATSSGATIYDPAIASMAIDQAKARFDPTLAVNNTFARTNPPQGTIDPLDPTQAIITGFATNTYDMNMGLSKVNSLGGTARLGVDVMPSRTDASGLAGLLGGGVGSFNPLNPQTTSKVELSYTQPLLQGAGLRANLAPIVIARLNTERSFFQFKDNVQQLVESVIQAYWTLIFARTDLWARQRQVEQGEEAYRRAEGRLRAGLADVAEVAQAKTALANFKATAIGSAANVLNQEAALANLLRLAPSEHLVPLSPPSPDRVMFNWQNLLDLAAERRPDIIELKLVLAADEQSLIQARNQARPQLDAVMLYRWNGLDGTMPNGSEISSRPGQFTEWNLGVNFSVPLGLRQGRAVLRQQQLILIRDRVNIDQGLHNAIHQLALALRTLAQYYDQYKAFKEARIAARINLDRQLENYRRGRSIFLNVLQAITDWGNAVSSESQALTQYNTELAVLEQQTGTILETHGVRFVEERFCSLGPLGSIGKQRCYPEALPPGPNQDKYPKGTQPGERFFDLSDPLKSTPGNVPAPAKRSNVLHPPG